MIDFNNVSKPFVKLNGTVLAPSLEATYGPYTNVSEAYNSIVETFKSTGIPVGLTVGIKNGNNIEEYWFNGGTSQANLVPKCNGGSGSGSSADGHKVHIITNLPQDTTTALQEAVPNAAVKDVVVDTMTGAVYLCYGISQWVKLNGTILTDAAPTTTRIVNAHILSYK